MRQGRAESDTTELLQHHKRNEAPADCCLAAAGDHCKLCRSAEAIEWARCSCRAASKSPRCDAFGSHHGAGGGQAQQRQPDKGAIPSLSALNTIVNHLQAYMRRIEEVNGALHAVTEINPDALAIAATLDEERRNGFIRGPLHGIPILLKDNIATADRMNNTGELPIDVLRRPTSFQLTLSQPAHFCLLAPKSLATQQLPANCAKLVPSS